MMTEHCITQKGKLDNYICLCCWFWCCWFWCYFDVDIIWIYFISMFVLSSNFYCLSGGHVCKKQAGKCGIVYATLFFFQSRTYLVKIGFIIMLPLLLLSIFFIFYILHQDTLFHHSVWVKSCFFKFRISFSAFRHVAVISIGKLSSLAGLVHYE